MDLIDVDHASVVYSDMETSLLVHEIDLLIADISARQIVPSSEVVDRLLDMRTLLAVPEEVATS